MVLMSCVRQSSGTLWIAIIDGRAKCEQRRYSYNIIAK